MSASETNHLFLLLGSNIEPERNLPAAVSELSNSAKIVTVSQVWESAPVGFTEQANFLNAAVEIATSMTATAFRSGPIADIEQKLQRVRDPENINAPRTIDIDIVPADDPDILTRAFVAVPLAEIAPDAIHTVDGRTFAEIATALHQHSSDLKLRPDVQLPGKSSQ